jgi:UDP-N-acetyl-D-galactosamine dehydrogenase
MNLSDRKIAVIGLGYVGLPLAVEFGRYREVIGFDINQERVLELSAMRDSTLEVEHSELLAAKHLIFTSHVEDLSSAQIYIVTVPTPIDNANRPDMNPLIRASELVGSLLKDGDLVIYESTVFPGATEEVCVPVLEEFSKLKFIKSDADTGRGFYCGYSPERVNPGDKERRLPDIKKITSGCTPLVAKAIDSLYGEIIKAGTHLVGSIKVAEAAKVIENSQRDLNIAFVNELSVIFERIGIDTAEVLDAASTKWNFLPFRPGLVGGHCIGVDPYYLTHKAEEVGYIPQVILAGRRINDNMGRYAARSVIRMMLQNGIDVARSTVGVMGITFKENCPDTRNSKVIDLIKELQAWNVNVVVSDPWVDAKDVLNEHGIEILPSNFGRSVDSLIIAVAHNQYKNIEIHNIRDICKDQTKPVLADLKSIYKKESLEELGFSVFRF